MKQLPARIFPVISVSRRTDIPAFFTPWFMQRIREGYCLTRNPFNPKQIAKVSLSPDSVNLLVFWTRNPAPLFPHIKELQQRGFRMVFLLTLTGYPRFLEPYCPEIEESLKNIESLSELVGSSNIAWRYDPILFSSHTNSTWHRENFRQLLNLIAPFAHHGILSIIDFYRKTTSRLAKELSPNQIFDENIRSNPECWNLLQDLYTIAQTRNFPLQFCCETDENILKSGIPQRPCLDPIWFSEVTGLEFSLLKDKGQRKNCQCFPSKDIGSNNSCRHGCLYCYATRSHEKALLRPHDPHGNEL